MWPKCFFMCFLLSFSLVCWGPQFETSLVFPLSRFGDFVFTSLFEILTTLVEITDYDYLDVSGYTVVY